MGTIEYTAIKAKDMALDLTQIDDIEFEGIDHKDYPDYCDTYISRAEYKGREMTEEELDDLNFNHSDFVYEKLQEHLY